MNPLQQHFRGIRNILLAQHANSAAIRHSGDKGTARENFISEFLGKSFPKKYVIGHGEIFDSLGAISPQIDIAVYDEMFPVLDNGGIHRYIAEGVLAHLEVKSTLNAAELEFCLDRAARVKELKLKINPIMVTGSLRKTIPSFVFAYDGWTTRTAFEDAVTATVDEELERNSTPDGIFVLSGGYGYYRDDRGMKFFESQEDVLLVAFLRLANAINKNWSANINWDGYASDLDVTT